MTILNKFDECIERMKDEDISLQEYIDNNSVKSVTDTEVKSGVDRLIYNHALNKTQVVKICGTSMPTFNLVEKRLLENELVNEPFIQGQSNMYNRFDLAVFMNEFSVPKYSDNYNPITICIANHKGGVGKSTTLRTLASATALDTNLNATVAIVDLDPQGSCGLQGQPRDEDSIYLTIADIALRDIQENSPFHEYVEKYEMSPEDVVLAAAIPTHLPNLFIYSAFPDDERFSDYYHALDNNDKDVLVSQLTDFIIPVLKTKFDFIYIDLPPQDSPITWSGIKATELLITPIAPKALDYLSTKNFVRFTRDRIEQLKAQDQIKEWKILPVIVDYNDRNHIQTLDRVRRCYVDRLMNNVIEQSELFYAADNLQRTIYDIQKTECRDNKYTSIAKYEQALASSNSVYRELRSIVQNLAVKGK